MLKSFPHFSIETSKLMTKLSVTAGKYMVRKLFV